jgi:hypothetical protein
MTKKKSKAKKRKSKYAGSKVVQLTMDRAMKEKLDAIAADAYTDVPTVAQVLLATGMHMGRNGQDAALRDAFANIMAMDAKLRRCREVMEANDPGNALDIFGPPETKETPASTTPAPESPT